MRTVNLVFIVFVFSLICGCSSKSQPKQELDMSSVKNIDVPSDITKDEIGDFLALESYILLSNEVLLGQVEKIIIEKDKIFVLDHEPKIVCFDMQGKVLFKIDSRGAGPQDYNTIRDFAIDGISKKIIVFDEAKWKLHFYDFSTGEYLSNISTQFMAPSEIAVMDGSFFFKNMDVRFHVQKEHQFYLLYSKDGRQIDNMYLPHDAVADFNFDSEAFYYNEGSLLFVRPFDNVVYLLEKEKITPIYEIHLPNPLPLKKIEEKMNHYEIPTSGYSYGIDDVYIAEGILHFTFAKDGFIVSNFFDLATNKFLYSGMRVLGEARKRLPFYSLIDGVYKDKFFSFIPAHSYSITNGKQSHPEYFSDELLNMKEEDNGVLAFFTFDRE